MTTRRPLVAGNWKMNTDRRTAARLADEVAQGAADLAPRTDLAVFPPFVYLDAVGAALAKSGAPVALGAQDLSHEPNGAFTGEVSAAMLTDLGCTMVLTGHSERRHVIGEPDELIARKTHAAIRAGLTCVLCIGETLDQREAGQTDAVNERQTRAALKGLAEPDLARLVIAYEPVWAIGTGRTASPQDAQDAHHRIRLLIGSLYSPQAAATLRILYGGSVKPDNAAQLFAQPDIDGGLIGGASLKATDFLAIARGVPTP